RVPHPSRVLVNRSYEPAGTARAAFFEGCLSVPGWQAVVARHAEVRLRGQDEHGRELDEVFTGWPARIVQHETDHLDGLLYLDRAELRSLSTNEAVAARWGQPTPHPAAEALGFELP
ncbi:peptide deformylase, partial [Streptomyces sp. NPDC059468]|uniref:peptide deformylase n=1 Tax=Streptomyces sp. NPDC059468 TaxID=3346845 RepID=UPI00369FF605